MRLSVKQVCTTPCPRRSVQRHTNRALIVSPSRPPNRFVFKTFPKLVMQPSKALTYRHGLALLFDSATPGVWWSHALLLPPQSLRGCAIGRRLVDRGVDPSCLLLSGLQYPWICARKCLPNIAHVIAFYCTSATYLYPS